MSSNSSSLLAAHNYSLDSSCYVPSFFFPLGTSRETIDGDKDKIKNKEKFKRGPEHVRAHEHGDGDDGADADADAAREQP